MEKHNIDSIFRKVINESEDHFSAEANQAQERIWNQVQQNTKKRSLPLLLLLLVAASILLFISTGILTMSNLNARKEINALVELNNDLKSRAASGPQIPVAENEPVISPQINAVDTVYIEKTVIVEKPVARVEKIVDTVYIRQIVYVEKEFTPESIVAIEETTDADSIYQDITQNSETEILISNSEAESLKKEKRKKIQIKFGGNQNPGNNGTIALTSKL